ncbi:hypothetical protein E9531_01940 [Lampropedia puyangensis]|uniref:Uncharacterized protein n=1 Tax=Lampropedia puyangensis TaxID=1330072 RepID=A0A4V4GS99_9BURK|nr:hypothetical protein E9531_01940 [Lampropedia puyangensis]
MPQWISNEFRFGREQRICENKMPSETTYLKTLKAPFSALYAMADIPLRHQHKRAEKKVGNSDS